MKILDTKTRIQLTNILFLTDFSPSADAAIPYATDLAKRFGANLYVLHVQAPIITPVTHPATWAALQKAAEVERKMQRETLLKSFPDTQPKVLIQEGGFWSTLLSVVEQNKIDLIVLGTRGRSGVGKFLLGSVAEEIFRRAPCAVMTVGPHSAGESVRRRKISEIVYATNFSTESVAAASYAISLAQEFQAHLTLLHVIADEKADDLVTHSRELVKSAEHLLRNLIPSEAELWCEPRFAVEQGSPAEKILEVANSKKADLIVLGVHRPRGFPGAATHLPIATAHKVVSNAPCPVLTVRG
jgi:nucleotide-binding universal stress UspA family protein